MGRPTQVMFPLFGLNKGRVTTDQPFATSGEMSNVRLFDVLDKRARGGMRAGQIEWGNKDLIGGNNQPVVAVCVVHSVE